MDDARVDGTVWWYMDGTFLWYMDGLMMGVEETSVLCNHSSDRRMLEGNIPFWPGFFTNSDPT